MDVGRLHPRLVLPTGQPKAIDAWSRADLVDPRAKAVLKRVNADLRPGNLGAAKLTRATLLGEFLKHRVAPLQEHSLPLWRLGEADAALRLSSEALTDEDLVAALHSLVGGDVASPVGAPVPLFLRDDSEQVVNTMTTFNGEGLVPTEAPKDLAALAMVDVSSDSSSGSEEEEEEE